METCKDYEYMQNFKEPEQKTQVTNLKFNDAFVW